MSKETDYLFEMYKKYAPTKLVGTYECGTDESNKWLDNIIIAKKKIEALEIAKEHFVNIGGARGNFEGKKPTNEIVITLKDLTQEEYELLKEILHYYE